MNKSIKIILGAALVLLGVVVVLDILHLIAVNFFFKGWWTLFIIIPCLVGLLNDKSKTGSIFGLAIGVILLLAEQTIIDWGDIWKCILAVFAVVWGVTMIFGKGKYWANADSRTANEIDMINKNGREVKDINVAFCHQKYVFAGQKFEGAEVKVSFGSATIDLRGADILDGAVLTVRCSFAGIEVIVDPQLIVKVSTNTSFGGVDDSRRVIISDGAKTLYIDGDCSFGGVEIK